MNTTMQTLALQNGFDLPGEYEQAEVLLEESVYQIVTNKIIDALNDGVVPWRKPWRLNGIPGNTVPRNAITNRPYRGMTSSQHRTSPGIRSVSS